MEIFHFLKILAKVLTENVTAIEAGDWAEGMYVWQVYATNSGVSTDSTTAGSTTAGSTTLVETGKWIKE